MFGVRSSREKLTLCPNWLLESSPCDSLFFWQIVSSISSVRRSRSSFFSSSVRLTSISERGRDESIVLPSGIQSFLLFSSVIFSCILYFDIHLFSIVYKLGTNLNSFSCLWNLFGTFVSLLFCDKRFRIWILPFVLSFLYFYNSLNFFARRPRFNRWWWCCLSYIYIHSS